MDSLNALLDGMLKDAAALEYLKTLDVAMDYKRPDMPGQTNDVISQCQELIMQERRQIQKNLASKRDELKRHMNAQACGVCSAWKNSYGAGSEQSPYCRNPVHEASA